VVERSDHQLRIRFSNLSDGRSNLLGRRLPGQQGLRAGHASSPRWRPCRRGILRRDEKRRAGHRRDR